MYNTEEEYEKQEIQKIFGNFFSVLLKMKDLHSSRRTSRSLRGMRELILVE